MMRRRRGPGLVGVMARTAVIAGTATAVSNKVSMHQQEKYAGQQQAEYNAQMAQQAQMDEAAARAVAAQVPAPAAQAAIAAPAGDDLMTQLSKLADLKAAGILSDDEFAAAKAKLLA
jgi:hypothetical protein